MLQLAENCSIQMRENDNVNQGAFALKKIWEVFKE